jgi:5'-nucleotidase
LRVLLTNDDGIHAEGLRELCRTLERNLDIEVTVVAPDRERSATGHAITVHKPLHVDQIKVPDCHAQAYAINGTPADCTKLAVEALLPAPPDIIISGINRGPNLGTDVFYSGTVSAAIEGALLGVPSIAISLAEFDNPDFRVAARFASQLLVFVHREGIPPHTLLNVNVPALELPHIAGVAVTKLGVRRWKNVFDRRHDPRGKVYYWLAGEAMDMDAEPGSDVTALKNNLISITPIHIDLTNHELRSQVMVWEEHLTAFLEGGY